MTLPLRALEAAVVHGEDGALPVLRDLCLERGCRVRVSFPLGKGAVLPMVWIEPGTFLQGSPDDEEGRRQNEGPQRVVTLTRGFWMGETAVTQAQWRAVMGNNPSHFKGDNRPVEQVSWDDCRDFCERLHECVPWLGARLPTEAEWECACRAGTTGARYGPLDEVAWHSGNSGGETHPVGLKAPNPWGLYDMLGNVWEWCADSSPTWRPPPYPPGPVVDPCEGMRGGDAPFVGSGAAHGSPSPHAYERPTDTTPPRPPAPTASGSGWLATEGPNRVFRGGSWHGLARRVRAAYRDADPPGNRDDLLGFRMAGMGR